jgi:hypothetical protein
LEDNITAVLSTIPRDKYLDHELILISRRLFDDIEFCDCVLDLQHFVGHKCKLFSTRDIHNPQCKCCQTYRLTYFLGMLLQRLGMEGRLEAMDKSKLARAKIRDRTFNLKKENVKLYFSIIRHLNAFRDPANQREILETWQFNFSDLSLSKINFEPLHI